MIGKRTALAMVLSIALCRCAEPRYEIRHPTPLAGSLQTEKVSDCPTRFQNSGHCLLWRWEQKPTPSQAGSLVFKVVRANALDDSPVPINLPGSPALVLWMPSMGHGSVPTAVDQVDIGSYRATNVFFIMPGEWELKFQFKNGSVINDEAVVTLLF